MKKYATALGAGLGFTGFMVVLQRDEKGGVLMALVGGVLFTLLVAWQLGRQAKKADTKRELYAAEGVVKDAVAVLASGARRTQGWLFLTKQRLVFEPFAGSATARRLELPLPEVDVRNATGMLGANKLDVVAHGATHRFMLQDRELWVVTIKQTTSLLAAQAGERVTQPASSEAS